MKKLDLIGLLLHNVALEHSAIVQYIYHIFLIRDEEIRSEIEKIAREEMRHMKWFAQKVVQLGGEVDLKRSEDAIDFSRESVRSMIEADISAEDLAIETYSKQIELVKDDSVRKLLERVIGDEMNHRDRFGDLIDLVKEEEEKGSVGTDKRTLEVLNELLREEYAIILRYLKAFFHSKNCEYKDLMLDLAIESMVHMGDLGEKIGDLGGVPDLSKVDLPKDEGLSLPDQVREDILKEVASRDRYIREKEVLEREEVRKVLERIRHQEEYHRTRLSEFLEKVHKLTVGDLRKKI